MTSHSEEASSIVRLNIGGKKFFTTMDTLTVREPQSMLAAMFSGRHKISMDSEGHFFFDRDGKYFRHILNWLRGGALPKLSDAEFSELMCEANYYQISGLVSELLHHQKKAQQMSADLTRSEVIICLQSGKANFSGVNLSGLDLSNLNFANVKFIEACLKDVSFKGAYLMNADFRLADLTNANLRETNMEGANLEGATLKNAKLKHANLEGAHFHESDLEGAIMYTEHRS